MCVCVHSSTPHTGIIVILLQEAVNRGLTARFGKQRIEDTATLKQNSTSAQCNCHTVCIFYWTPDADLRLRHFLGQKSCDEVWRRVNFSLKKKKKKEQAEFRRVGRRHYSVKIKEEP